MAIVITALFLAVPLLVSGALHMAVVRHRVLRSWARPIHRRAFGENKTWRGFLIMMTATVPGVYLAQWLEPGLTPMLLVSLSDQSALVLGSLLGLAYTLAELPNSYLKRRLGIQPGQPAPKYPALFTFLDQADSAFGCALVYYWLLNPPLSVIVAILLLGPLIHLVANLSLFGLGLRKQPF